MEQTVININGVEYMITPFGSEQGLKLQAHIFKVVAPVMGDMVGAGEDINIAELFTKLANAIFASMTPEGFVALVKELVSKVYKGSRVVDFNTEFAQNYATLLKLVKEVLLVNFKDVFSLLGLSSTN